MTAYIQKLLIVLLFTPLLAQEKVGYHPLGEQRPVTSSYGWRTDPLSGRGREFHRGVDLQAIVGDPVYAWRDGVVLVAGYQGRSGKVVELKHTGRYRSKYHHLSRILVRVGQTVKAGEKIGEAGSTGNVTGPHLHFTITKDNRYVNPAPFLRATLKKKSHRGQNSPHSPQLPANKKRIAIYSVPSGARVYINGKYFAETPLELVFHYGLYKIEVKNGQAYQPGVRTILVNRDSRDSYTFRLNKKPPMAKSLPYSSPSVQAEPKASRRKSLASRSYRSRRRRLPGPEAAFLSIVPGMGQLYLGNEGWWISPAAMAVSYGMALGSRSIKDRYYKSYQNATDPVAVDTLYDKANHFYKMEQFFIKGVFVIWGIDIFTCFIQGVANQFKGHDLARKENKVEWQLAFEPQPNGSSVHLSVHW